MLKNNLGKGSGKFNFALKICPSCGSKKIICTLLEGELEYYCTECGLVIVQ